MQPNTAMIFVPPRFAADSILEAAHAGVELVIAITEGIPAHDELRVYNTLKRDHPGTRLIGPELSRHPLARQGQRRHHPRVVLQAGQRRRRLALGHADLPDRQRDRPGRASAAARSSASAATPCPGSSFVDVLELFQADEQTELIVLSGEIGGCRRGGGRRVHRRAREQARGRLHRRLHRAGRQADGPRRRDRLRDRWHGRGQGAGARSQGRARRAHADRGG